MESIEKKVFSILEDGANGITEQYRKNTLLSMLFQNSIKGRKSKEIDEIFHYIVKSVQAYNRERKKEYLPAIPIGLFISMTVDIYSQKIKENHFALFPSDKIFIISGKSASGKDTLLKEVAFSSIKNKPNSIVSFTTRLPRENEIEGEDYFFIDNKKFKDMISTKEILEYRKRVVTDNKGTKQEIYYGVGSSAIKDGQSYICVLDTTGERNIKKAFPERTVSIFLDVDDKTRKERAKKRGDFSEVSWLRRLKDDNKTFPNRVIGTYDYVISDNETLEEAMQDMFFIMAEEGKQSFFKFNECEQKKMFYVGKEQEKNEKFISQKMKV